MNIENTVNELKIIQLQLKSYNDKDRAINYLVEETKLSKEECIKAYEFIINLDLSEMDN